MDNICDVCMGEFDTLFEYNGVIVCELCLQQLEEEKEKEDKESDKGIS